MNFVAIDVETANESRASICQIGLARFADGELVDTWCSLVDPDDYFNDRNIAIHKITPAMVRGAPTLAALGGVLDAWMSARIAVSHSAFDRVSIQKAYSRTGRENPPWTWLDSSRVAKLVWPEFRNTGYSLGSLCRRLDYSYRAHDALEDAKACGHLLRQALATSGLGLDHWVSRTQLPIRAERLVSTGPLENLTIVFTGKLEMSRTEAEDLATSMGAAVSGSVGKRTTHLVVGDQDIRRLAGHEKSSKHRKAEELIAAGHEMQIVQESDFLALVNCLT